MTWTVATSRELATDLLARAGLHQANAELSADLIVLADTWGVTSHGLMRLPYYLERIAAGGYPPDAELATVTDTGPALALDGGGGLGHWQLWRAAEMGTARCRQFGVSAVSVGNSGHCGALGSYVLPALDAGQVALVSSNGPAVMPPWGGDEPLLSTSPLACGVPSKPRPAIVDLASSAVARGKIAAHASRGQPLGEGWAFDADGRSTTDPHEALLGMLAPLGGAKGFALAFLVEALTGGLSGPNLSPRVTDMFDSDDSAARQGIGHLVVTVDPQRLDVGGGSDVQGRLDELARRAAEHGGRLPGAGRLLPGEVDDGQELMLDQQVRDQLRTWAQRLRAGPPPPD